STLCELLYTDWKIFTRCGRRVPPTQEVAARGDAERKEALADAGRPVDEGRGIGRQQRRQDVGAARQVPRQQVGGGEDGKTGCILHSSIVRSSFNRVKRTLRKTTRSFSTIFLRGGESRKCGLRGQKSRFHRHPTRPPGVDD